MHVVVASVARTLDLAITIGKALPNRDHLFGRDAVLMRNHHKGRSGLAVSCPLHGQRTGRGCC